MSDSIAVALARPSATPSPIPYPLEEPDAHTLADIDDPVVLAAFRPLWAGVLGVLEIIKRAADPDRIEYVPAVAELIAATFNAVRPMRHDAAVLAANPTLIRAQLRSPAADPYPSAHEAATHAFNDFVRRFESAAVPGAFLRRGVPGVPPLPDLTPDLVVRRRAYLSRCVLAFDGQRLARLSGDLQAEALKACNPAAGLVIVTKTLLSWSQIEEAVRSHCPLYAKIDASELRKHIRRLADLDRDNCPIKFPDQGGQPRADYRRRILWLAEVGRNLGLH